VGKGPWFAMICVGFVLTTAFEGHMFKKNAMSRKDNNAMVEGEN